MPETIFLSWQMDTPPKTGRNFIERALNKAIKILAADAVVEKAPREDLAVDRDTQGVAGSPPIFTTILGKIDNAAVFVPDLTFVGKRVDDRPTPNPNVMLEYGWALKTHSYDFMIPVMNTAYGLPNQADMPFDLAHLRYPITYDCPPDSDDATRKLKNDSLANALAQAMRLKMENYGPSTLGSSAVQNPSTRFR